MKLNLLALRLKCCKAKEVTEPQAQEMAVLQHQVQKIKRHPGDAKLDASRVHIEDIIELKLLVAN